MTMDEYLNKLMNDKNFSEQIDKNLGIEEPKVGSPISKPKTSKWEQIFDIALAVLNVANDVINNSNAITGVSQNVNKGNSQGKRIIIIT